jgi:ATP-dependent DNA helicase RecG
LFKEAGWIEKYGSGVGRIILAFTNWGAPVPIFEEIGEGFRVTVFPSKSKTPQKSPQKKPAATALEKRLINFIKASPNTNRQVIAGALAISQETVKEYLHRLKEKGILRRHGGRKIGQWEIVA